MPTIRQTQFERLVSPGTNLSFVLGCVFFLQLVIHILGSALGALTALVGVMAAKGAPQEAAAAAVGIAFAVIPYCLGPPPELNVPRPVGRMINGREGLGVWHGHFFWRETP